MLTVADLELCEKLGFPQEIGEVLKNETGRKLFQLKLLDFETGREDLVEGLRCRCSNDKAEIQELDRVRSLLPAGYIAYHCLPGGLTAIGVIKEDPAADTFDWVRRNGTAGPNYGHGPEEVLEKLQSWHDLYGLEVLGAGLDWVQVRLLSLPPDFPGFCREVYEFCPDIIEQGFGNEVKDPNEPTKPFELKPVNRKAERWRKKLENRNKNWLQRLASLFQPPKPRPEAPPVTEIQIVAEQPQCRPITWEERETAALELMRQDLERDRVLWLWWD